MRRREFLKSSVVAAATAAASVDVSGAENTVEKPNIIIIIADQRHYGMSNRSIHVDRARMKSSRR